MYLSPVSPSPGAFPSKFFPLSKNISEHGPHGPVSPIDQKLSSSPSFASLVEDTPIFLSQISSDSLSSLWTVTQRRSSGSFSSSVKNSHAYSIAFSLKYSPKLKFPSISKKVWCLVVNPTFSRSLCLPPTRKHFCEVVAE